jgi:glycosyltransferase involved in cell wall biosynthesis
VQVVAVVLLHNEDVFAERVIRNVAGFCDRVHIADHMSTDGTWEIVSALARELDHVDATRIANSAQSHDLIAGYAGTNTWVIGPDGDELYDPGGLQRLREQLEEGRYDQVFRMMPAMLHAVSLDEQAGTATGYLSPPARPAGGKLFNFNAINSWTHVYRQCLHEGEIDFRDGWSWGSVANLGDEFDWDGNAFRCIHTCFMRRSSREREGTVRLNPIEAHSHRRDALGRAQLFLRRLGPSRQGVPWKLEKYRRGSVVTKDVTAFLAAAARS